jgi:hypothetical protein
MKPSPIPFPLSSFPGANPQESAGRLINCYAEPLGEPAKPSAPASQVWRGSAGLSQHALTAQAGYRGGLLGEEPRLRGVFQYRAHGRRRR